MTNMAMRIRDGRVKLACKPLGVEEPSEGISVRPYCCSCIEKKRMKNRVWGEGCDN